jgi:Glycosyl hydrolases family 16
MKNLLFLVLFVLLCITIPADNAHAQTPAVNLPSNYHLVFNENFSGPLSVSQYGPGTTWIAHTPYGGDFGDAWFGTGPQLSSANGILTMKAYYLQAQSHWVSGLIASVDPQKNGFAQALGYWECRIYWTGGLGTWPAFWLDGVNGIGSHTNNVAEIDILEAYGVNTSIAHQVVHVWSPTGSELSATGNQTTYDLANGPHVFSCLVNADFIHYYIDGNQVWSTPTPPEATLPLYCLVDLALGGGWPTTNTPNPSYMYVYYVRCWARSL